VSTGGRANRVLDERVNIAHRSFRTYCVKFDR
jgi:hypothetical protein